MILIMAHRDLRNPEYVRWRKSVYRRDHFQCQFPGCGHKGGKLNAHHIKPWAKYPSLRFVVSNGITLCESCHNIVWGKEEDYEPLFLSIVSQNKTRKRYKTSKKVENKALDIWLRNME